jgi:hypothetical protein
MDKPWDGSVWVFPNTQEEGDAQLAEIIERALNTPRLREIRRQMARELNDWMLNKWGLPPTASHVRQYVAPPYSLLLGYLIHEGSRTSPSTTSSTETGT